MTIATAPKSFKDIREEYNEIFVTEGIRDEDRAYRWHAKNVFRETREPKAILDVACGAGYFLRELRKLGPQTKLVGIDIADQAIELAQKECPDASYLLSVGENLPFAENSFDAITCLGSLEHFLNIEKAVREMIRVIRKDGIFYILVPNIFWYKDLWSVFISGDRKDRNQTQERFAAMGEWIRTLEHAGLKVVKTLKYNGIARKESKQWLKDLLIPLHFSYHFIFICKAK